MRDGHMDAMGRGLAGATLAIAVLLSPAEAAVSNFTVTDVTPKAFSIVWLSTEPVVDATVEIFADTDGFTDVTANFTVTLLSALHSDALDNGVVKVDMVGATPSTTYYLRTTTVDDLATTVAPAPGQALIPVTTADVTTKAALDGTPIANDVLTDDVLGPDRQTPVAGSLLLIRVPSLSAYPVTAFVGDGIGSPGALVDLNNVYDDSTGVNAKVEGGTPIDVEEWRGRACPPESQALRRVRRVPVRLESPAITELERPAPCFSPGDFTCDGLVDPLDFNKFLDNFGKSSTAGSPNCDFSSDFDLVQDGLVDPLDFNRFLDYFGDRDDTP